MIVLWGGPVLAIVLVYAVLWQITAPLRRGREERRMAERALRVRRWEVAIVEMEQHQEKVCEQDRFLREQRREDRRLRT